MARPRYDLTPAEANALVRAHARIQHAEAQLREAQEAAKELSAVIESRCPFVPEQFDGAALIGPDDGGDEAP